MFLRILFVLMAIISSSFLNQSFAVPQLKIDSVQYSLGKNAPTPFTLKGFGGPETSHIWTDGKTASITFPVEIDGRRVLSVMIKDTHALVTNSHPQTVSVFMNGTKLIGTYKYSVEKPVHNILVKIPSSMRGKAQITFKMPNAIQPSKLDPNNKDPRTLGLSISDVEVSYKKK